MNCTRIESNRIASGNELVPFHAIDRSIDRIMIRIRIRMFPVCLLIIDYWLLKQMFDIIWNGWNTTLNVLWNTVNAVVNQNKCHVTSLRVNFWDTIDCIRAVTFRNIWCLHLRYAIECNCNGNCNINTNDIATMLIWAELNWTLYVCWNERMNQNESNTMYAGYRHWHEIDAAVASIRRYLMAPSMACHGM